MTQHSTASNPAPPAVADQLHIAEQYAPAAPAAPRALPVTFTGNASDFFSIWIINTVLNVLTLGFYSPWAKIRTKRYFYGHTSLDGHTFDYVADPVAILKGRLVVMLLLVVIYGGALVNPLISLVGWLVVLPLTPWATVKSLSFNLRNTTYRGVRFGFTGDVGSLFYIFLVGGLLQMLTLGLYAPLFILNVIHFKLSHTRYGNEEMSFSKSPGFYGVYAVPLVLYMLMMFLVVALQFQLGMSANEGGLFINGALYPLLAIITALIQGGTFNYIARNLTLPGARFTSTLHRGELVWIYFTNLLAIVCSLGLALPWALTRTHAYKVSRLTVHIDDPALLTRVRDTAQSLGAAAGDAAVDLMDIDVGLA